MDRDDTRPRARVDLGGTHAARFHRAGRETDGEIHEASGDRVFVATGAPPPLDRLTSISIAIDEETSVSLMGRVIRRRSPEQVAQSNEPPGMGLRLTSANPDDLQRWQSFIRSHATEDATDLPRVVVELHESETLELLLDLDARAVELFVHGSHRHAPGTEVVCEIVHPEHNAVFELEAEVLDRIGGAPRERGLELSLQPIGDARADQLEMFVLGNTPKED